MQTLLKAEEVNGEFALCDGEITAHLVHVTDAAAARSPVHDKLLVARTLRSSSLCSTDVPKK